METNKLRTLYPYQFSIEYGDQYKNEVPKKVAGYARAALIGLGIAVTDAPVTDEKLQQLADFYRDGMMTKDDFLVKLTLDSECIYF